MKQRCAKEAFKRIKNDMIIGLGGGSTIAYLIDEIAASSLQVKIVTPSLQTKNLCLKRNLHVIPTDSVSKVDIAFDGCDEIDTNLRALKSNGGIHTKEKIIGSMAKDYVLLADESKLHDTLVFTHPIVLEIVKDSYQYVVEQVKALGGECKLRTVVNKNEEMLSDQFLLVDAFFKEVDNIEKLHDTLRNIVGVLEISLFINVATKALIVKEKEVILIEK